MVDLFTTVKTPQRSFLIQTFFAACRVATVAVEVLRSVDIFEALDMRCQTAFRKGCTDSPCLQQRGPALPHPPRSGDSGFLEMLHIRQPKIGSPLEFAFL